jgi:hypothetical protein
MLALVGILFIVGVSGYLVLFKWFPPGLSINTRVTSVPIIVDTGASNQTSRDPGGKGENYNMKIELSEGQPQPQEVQLLPQVTGEPLSPEELQKIFSRLPALPTTFGDQVEFNRPAESLPPPRPGVTIKDSFPPPDTSPTPSAVVSGPLEVMRFAPEGEIPIAPFVSITFNQPMVPLGTLEDLAQAAVPARIEPALTGTWGWLGTKTLTFQYDSELIDRLPKATEYRVSIPAGTKSITGGVLEKELSWTFTTPPPKVTASWPVDIPQPLEPLFFVAFDQRIDPAAVLRTIRVMAGNRQASLVLETDAEIQKNEEINRMVKNVLDGRWLVFRATESFPANTAIGVTIGPGTPSAEGPLVTKEAQSFGFTTYAPLRIQEHRCSWDVRCPPLTPFMIRFNNPLDQSIFTEDMLKVEPEILGVSANVYNDTIEITGQTKGRTTYTVTVSGDVQDVFGQKMGRDARLSFNLGSADPLLVGPNQNFVTLDPSVTKPVFSVYAINYKRLNLKIYAVQPTEWPDFKRYIQDWRQTDKTIKMPGTLVSDKVLNLDIPADSLSQLDISLSEFMRGSAGQFVVVIEPPKGLIENDNDRWNRINQTVITWVQVTHIGLDAFSDHTSLLAWATDLRNGAALSGVRIQPGNSNVTHLTGADGTARFEIPSGAAYLVATLGSDLAILPASSIPWNDGVWTATPAADMLRWYVFDDRKMYKPGEEVHIKGWLRRIGGQQNGDVSLVGNGVTGVSYRVSDPQGSTLGEGRADVNALGGFDFVLNIPKNANLGTAQLYLSAAGSMNSLAGAEYYYSFEVQEFRRPEFEVNARSETSGPYFAGGQAVVAVDAKYFAGGPLPNADVTWHVTTSSTNYSPPNWPDFTFGSWQPWWYFEDFGFRDGEQGKTETFNGKTDASGTHYLRLNFNVQGDPALEPRPQSVVAESTVMDVNRQAWSNSTALLVHPANVYIGIRSERTFVELNEPLKVDFIVTDLDGKPVGGRPVQITAARLEWKYRAGNWVEDEVEKQTCSHNSTTEPDNCLFQTPIGGTYRITAIVTDELGRKNQSRFTRWVSGGKLPPSRTVEQEQATLIPEKQTYQPGETARILVQAPFSPAEGLLTVSRSGMLYTRRFRMDSGSYTLEVPIEEAHIPNLEIQVELVGSAMRVSDDGLTPLPNLPDRPAYATGTLTLSIPPLKRTLALQVTPDENKLEPGAETALTVSLKDASGLPVADAEVAMVVVDEAILALTNYELDDPLSVFYSPRSADISGIYSRASLLLVDPQALAKLAANDTMSRQALGGMAAMATMAPAMQAPAVAEKAAPGQANPIRVRSDFNPLAVFAPSVRTGLDGSARIPVKLPDNLTRYRVMVVAVDSLGNRFGTGESSITARLPLMVRPSAPRFLNFGDRFELPVVLQNQTDQPMDVSVAARASNLELTSAGLRVTVPANDRVEVRFPAATMLAGTAQIQVAGLAGDFSDAATVELPVYTPSSSEAFATYGVIDNGSIAQPLQSPTGVFAQYGGLEITTSSTALQALTDAVLYLVSYPYECSEQLASRILAVASLRDVLMAFKAEGLPAPVALEAAVERDIAILSGLQNGDGGFPTWRRGFDSNPFDSIHVAHALEIARQKGFMVPNEMRQNVLNYLRQVENYYPAWYDLQTRRTLSAYALNVRAKMGDRDNAKAQALLKDAGLDGLRMEAIGWLWPVIDDKAQLDEIHRFVNNHVIETAGAANFTTNYSDQAYLLLSSDRRTDAILLDALMVDTATLNSDLLPKLVNGLLAHRIKGRWGNTQENVFVLLALDHYFNTFEAQTPDFVARIWLGNTYAGSSEFRGRTTDQHETAIPMTYVLSETSAGGGIQNLILSKDGPGRLYYRLGLRYAPQNLSLKPLDMGFVVQRKYEAVDNSADVSQAKDGSWHIKAGARVRVRISLVADNRRYHVALVDPLPAGLEIVNPALAVSGNIPQDPGSPIFGKGWWWWGTWYEHQNLRDDRAEAFASLLWDGVYDYSYIARASTPGTFVVPPAKAEEMYTPEVFGRSGSDRVVVE